MAQNKSFFAFSFFFFFGLMVHAQLTQGKYWVQFTDKNNSDFTITKPQKFLSQRAIDRRDRYNIPIEENDLPVNTHYIDSVLNCGNITLLQASKWFNAITIQTFDTVALDKVMQLSMVKKSEPVAIYTRANDFIDPAKSGEEVANGEVGEWNLYDYGASYNQVKMIGMNCLHNLGFDGEGMHIAVLDAGFRNVDQNVAFDSLWLNNRILGYWDFVAQEDSVFEDHPHGQSVLSTMGGYLPGELIGTAPKASYWLLRTEDGGSEYVIEEDNWIVAAEFADSAGVDVINTSLGYTTYDEASQSHTYEDMDGNTVRISIGADIAASKGMLCVTSAGNSGSGAWHYIGAPGDADSTLTVGAVDSTGLIANFSSRGPSSDGQVKPDVCAQGIQVKIAHPNGGTQNGGGTSFSSPLTAGAVASLWQAHPEKTNMEIIEAVRLSADNYYTPDEAYGYGIPNFCIAHQLLKGAAKHVFAEEHYIAAYPNPFAHSFSFSFYSKAAQTIVVELYDVAGRRVLKEEEELKENSLSDLQYTELGTLSEGIYTLRVITGEEVYEQKLMKY